MHFIALSVLIQIACAVHCLRNGRNNRWLTVIVFLSIPGCIAYVLFEVLPQYAGHREVRRLKQAAAKKLDPDRDVRNARAAIETADTAANRIALGDALADQGKWAEAIVQYEVAEATAPAADWSTGFRLARACFESGRFDRARKVLETLPPSSSPSENDRTDLLRARLHEEAGEADPALAIYQDVGRRMPGGEAQCRQAALLISLGRPKAALPLLAEVEKRVRKLDTFERANNADMYSWATRTLTELRG